MARSPQRSDAPPMAEKPVSDFAKRVWKGVLLRALKREEVIDQKDIADYITAASGKPTSSKLIHDWLYRGKMPKRERLIPLAKYLDIHPGDLEYGSRGESRPFSEYVPSSDDPPLTPVSGQDNDAPQPRATHKKARPKKSGGGEPHRRAG